RELHHDQQFRTLDLAHAVDPQDRRGALLPQSRHAEAAGLSAFPGGHGPALASLLGVQGIIEIVGGILLLLGLLTRPVAFVLAGDMAVAYFMVHLPRSFFPVLNGGEAAILYCFIFLYLFVAGGGAWSVDALRGGEAEPEED